MPKKKINTTQQHMVWIHLFFSLAAYYAWMRPLSILKKIKIGRNMRRFYEKHEWMPMATIRKLTLLSIVYKCHREKTYFWSFHRISTIHQALKWHQLKKQCKNEKDLFMLQYVMALETIKICNRIIWAWFFISAQIFSVFEITNKRER